MPKRLKTLDEITLDHIWSTIDNLTPTCHIADSDERFAHAIQETVAQYTDQTTEILGLMNLIVAASPLESREEVRRLVNSLEAAFEEIQMSVLKVCVRVADERGFRRGVQAHALALVQTSGEKA